VFGCPTERFASVEVIIKPSKFGRLLAIYLVADDPCAITFSFDKMCARNGLL
jgi:hypothetical protein